MKKNKKVFILLIPIIIVIVSAFVLNINKSETGLSKEEIIKRFEDNKEIFNEIQAYEGDYSGEGYFDKLSQYQKISNGHGVSRADDMIWFVLESENGFIEKGIVYIKSDILPEVPKGMGECSRIEKNWFYYVKSYT